MRHSENRANHQVEWYVFFILLEQTTIHHFRLSKNSSINYESRSPQRPITNATLSSGANNATLCCHPFRVNVLHVVCLCLCVFTTQTSKIEADTKQKMKSLFLLKTSSEKRKHLRPPNHFNGNCIYFRCYKINGLAVLPYLAINGKEFANPQ